ncbi:MAG: manganese efflux pump, partial [Clostridia bacterium]|nr:manganese efflux pump [Clostridia bacterium]
TSIDAMAVGITFALEGVYIHILLTVAIIGVVTCVLSMLGVKVGSVFGNKYEKKAQVLGGCILILLGVKILLEHLGVL